MLGWLIAQSVVYADPNFATAIAQSMSMQVAMAPDFGEGVGAFESHSRYRVESVNCMTWFQWVVATAYTHDNPSAFEQHLDAIRYYNQTIGFDTRKHFIERWLIYDPAPLGSLAAQECQTDAVRSVSLDLSSFRQQQGYSWSLYQENTQQERLIIPYMTQNRMDTCQGFLPDGYYAMFMVPNERWIARWSNIGEMGTVHAMILYRYQGNTLVYQASIDQKAVVSESWDAVSQRLSTVSKGYRLYQFDVNRIPESVGSFSSEACR